MRIALTAAAVDVYRMEKSATNATRDLVPAPDPLAEFEPEQTPPPRPVPFTVRPTPGAVDFAPRGTPPRDTIPRQRTPPVGTRRTSFPPVKRAQQIPATPARRGIRPFVLGSVCGALLCVLAVYSMTGEEVAQPEPDPPAAGPGPPASAPVVPAASEAPAPKPPAPVGNTELRDLPVIDRDLPAPPEPIAKSRSVREAATPAPPPPRETKRTVFVGALQIDSAPQGAQVFVDRKAVGVTPVLVTDLSAGSHAIRVEADGHLAWSSAVRVIADRQTHVNAILSPSSSSAPGFPQ